MHDHEPEPGRKLQTRLLLVAQTRLAREALSRILVEDELSVVGQEANLARALSFLRTGEQAIELLLYDQGHEEPDGLPALRTIRDEFPGVSVVILAAEMSRDDFDQAIDAGVRGILPKSFSSRSLCLTIRLLLLEKDLVAVPPGSLTAMCLAAPAGHARAKDIRQDLSSRENEILKLLRDGASNKAIARSLNLAESTVKVHLKSLMRKLDAGNRTQAAIWGLDQPASCAAGDEGDLD